MGLFTKVFGTYSQRELKSIYPIVDKITALEEDYKKLTDAQLQAKTPEFKERLANGETLDDILPEAFAAVREAADRVLGMRPYPVQLVGGIVLHQGRIAEMKTGEGKTFTLALPAYLNALTGKGVHVVTVNEYLAKYQGEMMARVFNFMGMTVGLALNGMSSQEKKAAYACDITYGTNNEMGFDYLRDNMAIYKSQMVQRGHAFAIVDEVDSILIDEARTPLIISGAGDKSTDLYEKADRFVCTLQKGEEPEEETIAPDSQDLTLAYYPDRSMNPLYGSDYTNRVVMSLMYQGLGGCGYHLPRHRKKPAWVYLRAVARLYLYGIFHGKSSLQSSIGQIFDLILYFTAAAFPWQGSVAVGFLPYMAVF